MPAPETKITWFERSIALAYATVAVLGLAVVIVTVSLYLPGVDQGTIPVP